jgi:hypothetical protein
LRNAYLKDRVEHIKNSHEALSSLTTEIATDPPILQHIVGLMLISETIMLRRLWRRYLRRHIRKSLPRERRGCSTGYLRSELTFVCD